jgi:hypothetical protein
MLGCDSCERICASRSRPRPRRGLEALVLAQHLDRDAPAQLLVPRLVDDAHAALAERGDDAQRSDLLAYEVFHALWSGVREAGAAAS